MYTACSETSHWFCELFISSFPPLATQPILPVKGNMALKMLFFMYSVAHFLWFFWCFSFKADLLVIGLTCFATWFRTRHPHKLQSFLFATDPRNFRDLQKQIFYDFSLDTEHQTPERALIKPPWSLTNFFTV